MVENVRIAVQSRYNYFNFWQDAADITDIRTRAEEILELVELADKPDVPAENLSHGEQRTLEIAISLGTSPDMLLLDEPSSGMSAEETRDVTRMVDQLSEELPVIIVEHKMSVIMDIADRITVLHNGRILADGPPREIQTDKEVQQVYLGGYRT